MLSYLCTESHTKCFENVLDLINLTYFGIQSGNPMPPSGQLRQELSSAQQIKRDSQPARSDARNCNSGQPGSKEDLAGPMNGHLTHKRMKLNSLDYLVNPLRTDHPFGKFHLQEICCAPDQNRWMLDLGPI